MHDPDFDPSKEKDVPVSDRRGWAWLRWACLVPIMAVMLPVLAITLKPFRYAERLARPVAVAEVTRRALLLADGTRLRLPFIKRIPLDDPVLKVVLEQGVEKDAEGRVYGLLCVRPICGMTAYHDFTYRVNLSDVIGALDPSELDESLIHPEEIAVLRENVDRPRNPRRIGGYFLLSVRRVGQMRERQEADRLGVGPSSSASQGP